MKNRSQTIATKTVINPAKLHLQIIQSGIERRQKQHQENFTNLLKEYNDNENALSDINQPIILECLKIGMTIFFSIKQIDKIANGIEKVIDKQFITKNTIEVLFHLLLHKLSDQIRKLRIH